MALLFLLLLFADCVSGAGTDEAMSVMEGDSVTLHTNLTEIQNDDTVLWMFGPKDLVISQITRKNDFTSFFVTDEAEFRGRLQPDQKTGSLTLRNTRIKHSGQYKLTISREQITTKIFSVTVFEAVGETDGVKSVSVMEGNFVTLHTDTEIHTDDLILWRFGDKGILLAKIDVETKETSLNDADERFKDLLQLDQTGSLTIKNSRTEHTGLYELQIRGRESSQQFLLSVTAVSEWTLSSGEIAAIVAAVLLVAAVLAGVVIYYRRKIAELHMVTTVKVMPGDSVILQTDTIIQKEDLMLWTFGAEKHLIVKVDSGSTSIGERFKDRLELDKLPRALTIKNMETTDSGQYKLQVMNREKITIKRFNVSVPMRTVPVMPGKSLTLQTDARILDDDLMLWTFGAEKHLIVKVYSGTTSIGERFKDRLEKDKLPGALTIRNMETTDSGQYKLQIINSKKTTIKKFNVSVTSSTKETEKESTALLSEEDQL